MIDLKLNPLSVADVDDLIEEMAVRFPRGMLFVAIKETPGENTESFFLDYRHGLSTCIGLAERAKARMLEIALSPGEGAPRET